VVDRTGFENRSAGASHPAASPPTASTCETAAQASPPRSALCSADSSAFPPDLAALVEAWARLPEAARRAFLAMVEGAASNRPAHTMK
jgi:hypothetical protein